MRMLFSSLFWPSCCMALGTAWFVTRQHETRLREQIAGDARFAETYQQAIARSLETKTAGRVLSWPRLPLIGDGLTPPVLLVADEASQVAAARVQIAGCVAWSLPFRQRVREYVSDGPSRMASADLGRHAR